MKNKLMIKITDIVFNKLLQDKKFVIRGLGTWHIKPAKRGEFKTKYGRGETKHNWRVSWKCSNVFKDRINDSMGNN